MISSALSRRLVAVSLLAALLGAGVVSQHEHDEGAVRSETGERCADVHLHAAEPNEHDDCLACLARVPGVVASLVLAPAASTAPSATDVAPPERPTLARPLAPDAPRGPPSEHAA